MAAKKAETKPKAQSKAKAEPKAIIESIPDPDPEAGQFLFSMKAEPVKVDLPFTPSQLAEMGRKFKVGLLGKVFVTDAHNAYLNAVAKGAEASEADVKFVKGHLEVIKGWNH